MKKTKNKALTDTLPQPIVEHIQHLERMRQDFVANVSHELRTPLTVIHGYLELLLDSSGNKNPKQLKTIFEEMNQQTTRMENLVENLLLLSRLENEQDTLKDAKAVDVKKILSSIVQEAKQLSGKSEHKIQLSADPTLKLRGIEDELRSLFSNIIFNAIKYTPAHGSINIEWFEKNHKAYFVVRDTGIGIAAKDIPRLTERFYRVDKARSRASGGTGLGLAIAKHVLMRHQGEFEIKSSLGKGSTFSCVFPI